MKLLVPVLFVPMLLTGASDPFVGVWKLNPDRSTPEKAAPPPPRGVTMVYTREGDVVTVAATVPLPDGTERKIVHTETYDGRPHDRYEGKPNGETLTHRRIDERTVETVWRKDGKPIAITTRTVSQDGRTLTSVVRSPGKSEPENVMVYDKE
jgi:hypothetical protein